jgi:hypothetical protein
MPKAPKAEPPHVHRGPLQSKGKLATASRAKKAYEGVVWPVAQQIAKYFSEISPLTLGKVAFDLDNTALRFPEVFVPMAQMFANCGVQVGVMTGNDTPEAREDWIDLGYPEPAFYEVHPEMDGETTAQWKAEECKKLGIDLIIDDFSGGRNIGIFRHFTDQVGSDTVALEVALPANAPYQQIGDPHGTPLS